MIMMDEYRDECLQQLREETDELRADLAERRARRLAGDETDMQANNFTGLTVATMSSAEYSRWVDLGRPPLGDATALAKRAHVNDIAQAIAAERKQARERALADVEVIAAEVARTQLAERRVLQDEIGQLRAEHATELAIIRTELATLKAGRGTKPKVRIPAGRADGAARFGSH